MTALHFSWMSPSGSLAHADMEETYLHHKLEAMRHVNELVADPQLCTSDDCIGLIAALAMAEVCLSTPTSFQYPRVLENKNDGD